MVYGHYSCTHEHTKSKYLWIFFLNQVTLTTYVLLNINTLLCGTISGLLMDFHKHLIVETMIFVKNTATITIQCSTDTLYDSKLNSFLKFLH